MSLVDTELAVYRLDVSEFPTPATHCRCASAAIPDECCPTACSPRVSLSFHACELKQANTSTSMHTADGLAMAYLVKRQSTSERVIMNDIAGHSETKVAFFSAGHG